ncbi:MAG: glycosyl hydrolase family 17 protein, partial [Bacteroidota bacterium]
LSEDESKLDVVSGLNLKSSSLPELRRIFTQTINKGIHGLCFSPYVEGQGAGDILTEEQIRRRIDIIQPYTSSIRSFSCTEGNEMIPSIAREKGLKTMVGAWISNDKRRNEQEINELVKLAEEGLVDIATIGNEVLLRKELSAVEIIAYLKEARSRIPDHIPIGYVDAYYQFLEVPGLANHCDVILINCYPFWEGADENYALAYLDQMYNLVQGAAQGKEVIITETGWPSQGQSVQAAQPNEYNAIKYFLNVQHWAKEKQVACYYFSSFDESWKVVQEGEVGTRWGLWDKNERSKYSS